MEAVTGPVSAGRMRSWLGRRGGVTAALAVALAAGLIFTGGTDAFYSAALTSGASTFSAGTGTWDYSAQVLADSPVGVLAARGRRRLRHRRRPDRHQSGHLPERPRPRQARRSRAPLRAATPPPASTASTTPSRSPPRPRWTRRRRSLSRHGSSTPSTAPKGPIVEYNNSSTFGVQLWRNSGPNDLYANFVDTGGVSHKV